MCEIDTAETTAAACHMLVENVLAPLHMTLAISKSGNSNTNGGTTQTTRQHQLQLLDKAAMPQNKTKLTSFLLLIRHVSGCPFYDLPVPCSGHSWVRE
jgi:hypothetical protein